jgi:hypothetical protein
MRAIDADALIDKTDDRYSLGEIGRRERDDIVNAVEFAPTIGERKTGKWIERNPQNSDKCRLIECSECGNAYIVPFNVPYEHWIDGRNFCIRCGADLRNVGGK